MGELTKANYNFVKKMNVKETGTYVLNKDERYRTSNHKGPNVKEVVADVSDCMVNDRIQFFGFWRDHVRSLFELVYCWIFLHSLLNVYGFSNRVLFFYSWVINDLVCDLLPFKGERRKKN